MRSFTNITYDELAVGASATVSRRISQTEVDALTLVSGDVDAFHLAANGTGHHVGTTAKAVGAEAIISGLLSRRMPGPGTTLVSQQLAFNGAIAAGDELSASATVVEKRADNIVVLDCNVKRGDEVLVVGTVTVRAPTERISYSDVATPEMVLRRNDAFARLLHRCEELPPVRCAIVHPCDRDSLLGPLEAARRGLIIPVLVGPEGHLATYRKAHLFSDELDLFSPGDTGFFVTPVRGVRIGMMICFDWVFPESARCLALLGADAVLDQRGDLPRLPEMMRDQAHDDVGAAAGAERHHETDLGRRIVGLRMRRQRKRRHQEKEKDSWLHVTT